MSVKDLRVSLLDPLDGRFREVVRADLQLRRGGLLSVIGASGGGKSTLAQAICGVLPASSRFQVDSWQLGTRDLVPGSLPKQGSGRELQMALAPEGHFYLPQFARSSLVPSKSIRWHLNAARQGRESKNDRKQIVQRLARYFDVSDRHAEGILDRLPKQLSTGQCQRVLFAMAMLMNPGVLVADEPFASMDHRIAAILMDDMSEYLHNGGAVMFVTHQLSSLKRFADGHCLVIHDGQVAQASPIREIFDGKRASETESLIQLSTCRLKSPAVQGDARRREPVLTVRDVGIRLGGRRVFDRQSFEVSEGCRLGVSGNSGGGKTTVARILCGLLDHDTGHVDRYGQSVLSGRARDVQKRALWKRIQLTYQDTDLVFDPNEPVGASIMRCLKLTTRARSRREKAAEYFSACGLTEDMMSAPPVRLSGGQRKRAAIARSLCVLENSLADRDLPRVLLLDEPTVGVDVVYQTIIATALAEAQQRMNLALVVFSHDRSFLTRFCDDIMPWPIVAADETMNSPREP